MAAHPPSPGAIARLSNYIERLNPVPGFPEYTGPHKVGTVDVEIPVSDLEAACPTPEDAHDIHTVLFRVFYPTTPEAKGKRITWLPNPQRTYLAGYGQFVGASPLVSSIVSFLPRHLHYATIPALKNTPLLEPPADGAHGGRWPTMIFSHGLGGSRNAYSHIAGLLASHGVVVICPEHRDGSSIASLIRNPAPAPKGFFAQKPRSALVSYRSIPHTATPETSEARDAQLRIRTWELGLIFDAIVSIDQGKADRLPNLNTSTPLRYLKQFASKLNVHEPGRVIWAGHSFGAATMTQLLKSTYYADVAEVKAIEKPIFAPFTSAKIRKQITESSIAVLLDMWCLPIVSPQQVPLLRLPYPCYTADKPNAPGGDALLAIESDAFFRWTEHLHTKAFILSADTSVRPVVDASCFERQTAGGQIRQLPKPNFFYVRESAHLNQSDFGILFPWLTRRMFDAREPERALRLNLRAILQMMRRNGHPVARTCAADLVDGHPGVGNAEKGLTGDGIDDDLAILDPNVAVSGGIDAWAHIDIVGLGLKSKLVEAKKSAELNDSDDTSTTTTGIRRATTRDEEGELEMQGEIEPHLARKPSGTGKA